jgi:N6-L-threonylcarbamoyladenine synthase
MKILAIETSCDETAIALIETAKQKIKVLENLVLSQARLHRPYGGVVPHLAKREHARALPVLWKKLQEKQKLSPGDIDMVAVTHGPGLSPCLWEGINFAKTISKELRASLFGINHLKGHIYIVFPSQKQIAYPILSLIASGGHTELVLSNKRGEYKLLGSTRDDAAGEAFDKVAKLLGLSYPGGREISRIAKEGNVKRFDFPRPMMDSKDLDFSFAGLKTSVVYLVKGFDGKKEYPPLALTEKNKADVAASFEKAAVDVLVEKTLRAAKKFSPKTITLGGGVAANTRLREELKRRVSKDLPGVPLILPDPKLTTDNALMIALAAYYERAFLHPKRTLKALPNLKITQK